MTKPVVQVAGIYDLIKHKSINTAMQKVFLEIWHFLQRQNKKDREKYNALQTEIGILQGHVKALQKARLKDDE